MKVTIFGVKGMVGSRVVELLKNDFEFVAPTKQEVDITDKVSLKKLLGKEVPQVVVNFTAITDVDYCETERENKNGIVWKVNALAPRTLDELSQKLNYFFIQISTDMVFPGSKENPGPYAETHQIGKFSDLTWYGASKAEGEVGVEITKNAVVRIIYPVRTNYPPKLDYARKIIKLYDEGKLYPMFTDQHMNITYIDELALALKIIVTKKLSGVHHVASSGLTTPYEFAKYLLEKTRKTKDGVKRASFEEFIKGRDRLRYPQFGGLEVNDTEASLGIKFSTWESVIDKISPALQLG